MGDALLEKPDATIKTLLGSAGYLRDSVPSYAAEPWLTLLQKADGRGTEDKPLLKYREWEVASGSHSAGFKLDNEDQDNMKLYWRQMTEDKRKIFNEALLGGVKAGALVTKAQVSKMTATKPSGWTGDWLTEASVKNTLTKAQWLKDQGYAISSDLLRNPEAGQGEMYGMRSGALPLTLADRDGRVRQVGETAFDVPEGGFSWDRSFKWKGQAGGKAYHHVTESDETQDVSFNMMQVKRVAIWTAEGIKAGKNTGMKIAKDEESEEITSRWTIVALKWCITFTINVKYAITMHMDFWQQY